MAIFFAVIFFVVGLFKAFSAKRKKSIWAKGYALFVSIISFFLSLVLAVLVISFPKTDTPLLSITVTGDAAFEEVEWKPPYGPLQVQTLPTYQVIIISSSGFEKKDFFFGELLGVRMKTLQLHPLLNVFGFTNPTRIECIYSDYHSPDKIAVFPSKKIELEKSSSWFIWEKLFYEQGHFWGVKNASLRTEYIPLVNSSGAPILGTFTFPVLKNNN